MKRILITEAAMAAIRGAVEDGHTLKQTATRVGDHWSVPVQDDTYARLQEMKAAGESDSDVIVRGIFLHTNEGKLN